MPPNRAPDLVEQEAQRFRSLVGAKIVAVDGGRDEIGEWTGAALILDDGRRITFYSCSCCQGLAIGEDPASE